MAGGFPMKKLTSCDTCRSRKVRCLKEREEDASCILCVKRGDTCHFSPVRIRKSANSSRASIHSVPSTQHASSPLTTEAPLSQRLVAEEATILPSPTSDQLLNDNASPVGLASASENPPQDVDNVQSASPTSTTRHSFIDDILFSNEPPLSKPTKSATFTIDDERVGSSSLAFFSEKSMLSLSRKLGHDKVRQLITTIEAHTQWCQTLLTDVDPSYEPDTIPPQLERDLQLLSDDTAGSFIDRYFEEVHPVYPIFDRQWFDKMCLTYNPGHAYCPNKPWAAIYWTVLALGCMHAGGGSFTPGQGLSWELFSKALALYASVILSKKVLISTQALCIMAVYSMSVEGFRYETLFITEAARAAVFMGKTGIQNPEDELARRRTFWIIYCLEKELSFHTATASLICDDEVCCLLPSPERVLTDGLDWIRTWAGLCRIMSRAYTSLFSPGSRARSEEECLAEIKSVEADTEAWKQSMPESLRPGEPLQRFHFSQPSTRAIALRIHLLYHGFISSLARYTLHTCRNGPSEQLADARWSLMVAARSTVSLTQYIPQEPFTSMILLYHMPIAALFILFDFVVYNPGHAETKKNLSFLDIAAGYFARLELVCMSRGGHPGVNLAEFALICRQHVNTHGREVDRAENLGHGSGRQHMASTWTDDQCPASETAAAAMKTPDTMRNVPGTPLSGHIPGLPFQQPHTEDEAMLDMDISAELDFPIDESLLAFDLYAWNYNPSGTADI